MRRATHSPEFPVSNSQEADVVGLNSSVQLPLFVILILMALVILITYNDTNN